MLKKKVVLLFVFVVLISCFGVNAFNSYDITLTGGDTYTLSFEDTKGNSVDLSLVYKAPGELQWGDSSSELILDPDTSNGNDDVQVEDYFILTDYADKKDGKTEILQYSSYSYDSDINTLFITLDPVSGGDGYTVSMTDATSKLQGTLVVDGISYTVRNNSDGAGDDPRITIDRNSGAHINDKIIAKGGVLISLDSSVKPNNIHFSKVSATDQELSFEFKQPGEKDTYVQMSIKKPSESEWSVDGIHYNYITDSGLNAVFDTPDKASQGLTLTVTEPTEDKCTDSDDGKNYYVKGTVSLLERDIESNDQCSTKIGDGYVGQTSCSDDNCYVAEKYCDSSLSSDVSIDIYKCPSGCSEGACTRKTAECTDSDDGKDYYVKGTTTRTTYYSTGNPKAVSSGHDACHDSNSLVEKYCDSSDIKTITYACPYGCGNGVCLEETVEPDETVCSDSDGGKDYYKKGLVVDEENTGQDSCNYDSVMEYYCEKNVLRFEKVPCSYKCYNGACINEDTKLDEALCNDSDGGKDYYKKGIVTVEGMGNHLDSCQDYEILMERYCENGIMKSEEYECPYGCSYHVCKTETGDNINCADSDDGKEFYEKGFVKIENTVYHDTCLGNSLKEKYCENGKVETYSYICPVYCKNGECLDKTPTKKEKCNGLDDNGDGEIDEIFDNDSDGYFNIQFCKYVNKYKNKLDCNDNDDKAYEDAVEVCDGSDNDCNEETDKINGRILQKVFDDPEGKYYQACQESEWKRGECLQTENCEEDIDSDCDGLIPRDDPDCEDFEGETMNIELFEGWNVIPIPLYLISNDIDNVLGSIKEDIVVVREYAKGEVKVYDPRVDNKFNSLKTIEGKKAYQIKMKKAGTLTLKGKQIPNEDKKVKLHEEWNCFSYLGDEEKTIEEVFGNDLNEILVLREYGPNTVYLYNPEVPEYVSDLKTLKPNTGYQIKLKESIELDFSTPPKVEENIKDMDKYQDKQVFLISDKDWHEVLPLIPVTTWTGEEEWCQEGYGTEEGVCVYPTLIWHEESSGFDADSIIYFMQQYSPNKVIVVGQTSEKLDNLLITEPELGAGLNSNQLSKINANYYFSYWESFGDIVYVEDNYEFALLASTYASLINAPLVIQGTNLDTENVFDGKNVICVGDVNKNCNEKYNLEQLQQKYVSKTNTNKIILVNSNDLNLKIDEKFFPQKSKDPINSLYTKSSLSAPLLASAKHEIIISTSSINYPEVDNFIENKITNLNLNPKYLTIIASPNAIEMSYRWVGGSSFKRFIATDQWQYSKIDNDIFLDLAVGRIFSLTSSDVSSNIARSLFYDVTLKNENKILVTRGSPTVRIAAQVYALGKVMSVIGYDTTVNPKSTISEDWKNKFYISYNDHGFSSWAGIHSSNIPYLDNSFVITMACLTCAFKESTNNDGTYDRDSQKLFCSNILRKGGVGYIGATDLSADYNKLGFTSEIFAQESTIGEAFMNAKNSEILWKGYTNEKSPDAGNNVMPWMVLLGDPTLKLKIVNKMTKPQLRLIEDKGNERKYKLIAPAMKIDIPENVKNLCESPKGVTPLYFTTVHNCQFDTYNKFSSRFEVIPNFDVTAAKVLDKKSYIAIDKQKQDNLWITIQSDYNDIDYFDSANDQGFTDSSFDISLFNKASDLIIEDVSLLDHKLSFNIKNIGNKETGTINFMIKISTKVCVNERCSSLDPTTFTFININYNYKKLKKELSLSPGKSEKIVITLPKKGSNGFILEDYEKAKIRIWFGSFIPENFVQQKYYNDIFDEIVEVG